MKAGFVGLIGLPNAGKSTLLNELVEEKVSIVTSKPQTTRRRVLGLFNADQLQAVVVDAPGVIRSGKGLNAFLEKEALDVASQSDVLCAVLNTDSEHKQDLEQILELVRSQGKPWFVVFTKVDLSEHRARREGLKVEILAKHPQVRFLEFSKSWGKDLKEFREQFLSVCSELLPESPAPLYDTEIYTPQTLREIAAEVIREKCFEELHQELPYQLAVRIAKFDESSEKITKIFAEILVGKENHKPILIGKGGAQIKKIGMQARVELEKVLDQKVFLQLDVVVRENWFENPRMMKEFGYVLESE